MSKAAAWYHGQISGTGKFSWVTPEELKFRVRRARFLNWLVRQPCVGHVSSLDLRITGARVLTATEAVAFARWIIDTFTDEPAKDAAP